MGAEKTKKVQDNESKAGQICPSWGVSCEQGH